MANAPALCVITSYSIHYTKLYELHRFEIQSRQKAKASDFMMREGVWEGGEQLAPDDQVGDLLKHGSLSIGFIGLAECMKALYRITSYNVCYTKLLRLHDA